jgi:hypothetical protein
MRLGHQEWISPHGGRRHVAARFFGSRYGETRVSGIYLRQGDEFIAMREAPYEAESLLQALLAEHPEVLAGDDSDDGQRAWLLIRREAAVADEPDGGARWSLDHLFLDREGIPTLVEVKRSTDSRIRREVVGQMLDYAANAAVHWKVEALRAWFEAECDKRDQDAGAVLAEAFEGIDDADAYWETVRTNLAARKLRLVFVADEIPSELKRVVEFLNGQMAGTEVLAIEVKQYVDAAGQRQTIVPRILGQTEAARQAKGRSESRRWDRESVLAELELQRGRDEAAVGRRIFDWVDRRGDLRSYFGSGRKDGSFQAGLDQPARLFPFVLYTYGRVEIQFEYMRRRAPFDARELREELRRRLNSIDGVEIPLDATDKRPSIPLALMVDAAALEQLLKVLDWTFAQAL